MTGAVRVLHLVGGSLGNCFVPFFMFGELGRGHGEQRACVRPSFSCEPCGWCFSPIVGLSRGHVIGPGGLFVSLKPIRLAKIVPVASLRALLLLLSAVFLG